MENLERSTTYYVRAYAKNAAGTGFGNEISFTTPDLIEHEYVDLGLPSGTLWATDDVNIDNQWGVFAWGETLIQPASNWYGPYNWNSYQYCNNSENTLTKYCNNSNYGYGGFTDPLTVLLPEDDAATINWGSDWRTPTIEEWMELYDNTTKSWTMSGDLVLTASNGNSLILPSAGFFWDGYCSGCYLGDWDPYPGYYWSSSLYTDNPSHAWTFSFIIDFRDDYCLGYSSHERRGAGLSIRAVRSTP